MSRVPKRLPQILTKEEFDRVIRIILDEENVKTQKQKFSRLRNVICLNLMYYCGLRPMESYACKVSYVDFNKKMLYIPAQANKQRHEDNVDLPDFIVEMLYSYIIIKNKFFKETDWLFPVRNNNVINHIDRSHIAKVFRDAIKKAELYKISYTDKQGLNRANLSLYSLRASYGTFVYSKTKDIRRTALMLRHRDYFCRSTLCYIQVVEAFERKSIIKELFPQQEVSIFSS